MRSLLILSGVILALPLLYGTFLFLDHGEPENVETVTTLSDNPAHFRAYWTTYMNTHGPQATTAALESAFTNEHPYEQHFAAHIIGEIFYDDGNLANIGSCTALYGFGCYHGFISTAISTLGESAVAELDTFCINMFGGKLDTENCQHGIGHGILEFLGHKNITEALTLCDTTHDVFTALGCKSGVFMEFFHPLGDIDDLTPPFSEEDPYSICDNVTTEAKQTCIFEIHGWWRDSGGLSPEEIGALCNAIPEQRPREFCFLGYGNFIAPQVDFSIPKAKSYCERMPTSEGVTLCRSGTLWRLHFVTDWESATTVCGAQEDVSYTECVLRAGFTCELEGNCEQFDL